MDLHSLPTPCVLVDQGRVERNIEMMQRAADRAGKRLRPHAKTHKSPDLAKRQLAAGACGICCAKLGEAEVFAAAGVEDIRLPYPLNPVNAPRLLALLDRARISFIVDHTAVATGWSRAMRDAGREVDVLVKVDVGFHRCGIEPDTPDAIRFVTWVAGLPGLNFRGLLSHAGHAYHAGSSKEVESIAIAEASLMNGLAGRVRDAGVTVHEISVGATPTARFSVDLDGITELRPGNYVYFDRTQVTLGAARWTDCALTVLARVVTRPAPDRIILDSGSKTLTTDVGRGAGVMDGYGAVMTSLDATSPDDNLLVERLSEEHATVRVRGESRLQPGDLVRIVPNHSCVVSNLVDSAWLVDGRAVLGSLQVAARGRIA